MAYKPQRRRNENPRDQFNRLVGNRTGRPTRTLPKPIVDTDYNREMRIRSVARGDIGVPTRVTRDYNNRISPTGLRRRADIQPAAQSIFDSLVQKYQQSAAEQIAIEQRQQEEDDRDYPWWQDVSNAITGLGGDESGGFSDSIIGRGLDLLSRPSYALFEGLQSVGEHEDSSWAPSNLINIFKEFGAGVGRGITGEDKTGFGQVYEAVQNNPNLASGRALSAFEEAHPNLEQWVSRGVGLGGELFLDPLNYLIPAAPKVLRETGEVAGEQSLRQLMLNAAGDVTDEFANNLPASNVYSNSALLVDRVRRAIDEQYNRALLDVEGGGSVGTRLLNDRLWPTTVANKTTAEIRNALTERPLQYIEDLWTRGRKGTITPEVVDAFRNSVDDYNKFLDELGTRLVDRRILPEDYSIEDLLDAIQSGRVSRPLWDQAIRTAMSHYDSDLDNVYRNIFSRVENPTYRTVGIRVGNREVPVRFIGRAYDNISRRVGNRLPNLSRNLDNVFIERNFSGILGGKIGRARALGFSDFDKFRSELREFARKYSPDQAREIQKYLEEGVTSVGDKLIDDALDFIRRKYDEIWLDEQTNGVNVAANREPNYAWIQNKGGSRDARRAFDKNRGRALNDSNIIGAGEFNSARARELGLRPVESAFHNLMYRYAKSKRDIVDAIFFDDLVTNYGIHSPFKLSKKAIREANLQEISPNKLAASFRQTLQQKGGVFYIPKAFYDPVGKSGIYDLFEKINDWSAAELGQFGRSLGKVISKLKIMLTLPFPGFHMRNMIGDVAMGLLDDINPTIYEEVARKFIANKAGRTSFFNIIPGMQKTFNEMKKIFDETADTGFFRVDFDTYESLTAGRLPRHMARGAVDAATRFSDMRESMGRFVHFVGAFKQEANALYKRGMRDLDEITRRATDAATWRVNKYKFDYSALMPFEKAGKTLLFPFYTYLRKAIPVLLEQMYLNPKYFSVLNRFMEYNDGSDADGFNEMNIPQWIRDIGFGVLSDEEEPWAVTSDLLPFGALDILASNSPEEFSANLLGNLNPIAQAPIELATGQELFNGRPTPDNFWEYLLNQMPMLGEIQQEVLNPEYRGRWWENRLTGLGLPIRRITTGQQEQQQQENRDRLIDDPIRDFNYSQDAYSISTGTGENGQLEYRLTDKITGRRIAASASLEQLLTYVDQLPGRDYQAPEVSPLHAPTYADVQTMMGLR